VIKIFKKSAFVTGGAKRLGKEICIGLAKQGYNIAFTYLNSIDDSKQTEIELNDIGVKVARIKTDLTKSKEIKNFFNVGIQKIGTPDILINNASVFKRVKFSELNEKFFDEAISTNLKAYYLCSLEVAKYMKRGGRIINISSLGGIKPYKNYLPYSVSKAGVIMLTKCLALELAPKIFVNSIAPGILNLPNEKQVKYLPKENKIPLRKYGMLNEITNSILYLINSEYITGEVVLIDGGKCLS
jgi:3-oxoacyl-[acyl-carrier protein] reductase